MGERESRLSAMPRGVIALRAGGRQLTLSASVPFPSTLALSELSLSLSLQVVSRGLAQMLS